MCQSAIDAGMAEVYVLTLILREIARMSEICYQI